MPRRAASWRCRSCHCRDFALVALLLSGQPLAFLLVWHITDVISRCEFCRVDSFRANSWIFHPYRLAESPDDDIIDHDISSSRPSGRERERERRVLWHKLSIDQIIHSLSCQCRSCDTEINVYIKCPNIHQRWKLRKRLLAVSVTRNR